jgi:hypothetical protein
MTKAKTITTSPVISAVMTFDKCSPTAPCAPERTPWRPRERPAVVGTLILL